MRKVRNDMAKCKNCSNLKKQIDWMSGIRYPWCYEINDSPDLEIDRECSKYYGKTNGDRIRNMSNEELAEHFSDLIKDTQEHEYCEDVSDWLIWLQKEVE